MQLPSQFVRLTGSSNKVIKQLTLLRKDKTERARQGHVLVQGIKTIQELAQKRIPIATLGITLPASPADSTAEQGHSHPTARVQSRQALVGSHAADNHPVDLRGSSLELVQAIARGEIQAGQYLAVSRALTSKLLGTQSPTSEHEVWAKVRTMDHSHRFDPSSSRLVERMLVLDRITDPGNMGLMIRAGSALGWDGSWHTPGTVDEMNDKVIRASRALCLEWPVKAGGTWSQLDQFLQYRRMALVVADMLPASASVQKGGAASKKDRSMLEVDPYQLAWWNWPTGLPSTTLPNRIALVLSSEHHGVRAHQETEMEQQVKSRLLDNAIRVSIPMATGVESMNVATAATTMMWEINQLVHRKGVPQILRIAQ
ncbi:hypothetical protein DFQ26_005506 [Actinomortierella ambigua]|nr:hypothetical protein DFQ26_005506 [Actinomortierella ambigua]